MPESNIRQYIESAISDKNTIRINSLIESYIDEIQPHIGILESFITKPELGPWRYNIDNVMQLLRVFPNRKQLLSTVFSWIDSGQLLVPTEDSKAAADVLLRYLLRSYDDWNLAYKDIWQRTKDTTIERLISDEVEHGAYGYMMLYDLRSAIDDSLMIDAKLLGLEFAESCEIAIGKKSDYYYASKVIIRGIREKAGVTTRGAIGMQSLMKEVNTVNAKADAAIEILQKVVTRKQSAG